MSLIRHLDINLTTPAENLALEEVLLDAVEGAGSEDTLRLWESSTTFVTLGTGQQWQREVIEEHCTKDGIPIMRRCSAGGCVLQGPGCLNYGLFLTYARFPELKGITASYKFILAKIIAAFKTRDIPLAQNGISDLTFAGRKISGSAQRRRKHALLHHGTLLYEPNIKGMTRYLREPADRPEYRGDRGHDDFIGQLPLTAPALKSVLVQAFSAGPIPSPLAACELTDSGALAREKYSTDDWIKRR